MGKTRARRSDAMSAPRLKAVVRKLELQELVAQVDAPRPALQVVAHAPEEFPEPRVLRALMGATSKK